MFGGPKIKLDKDLLARLKKVSDTAGYATVEEFITHILEKELQHFEDAEATRTSEQAARARLHQLSVPSR
jgi:metal-responsive CopG/Arc/MetJ family transcriptional regulator